MTGDASDPFSWHVGNDAVSSIKFVGLWTATLYEHTNYQGISSTFSGDDADLGNDSIGHDSTSSIRVQRVSLGTHRYPSGDLNKDCVVDNTDVAIIEAAFGAKVGDPKFDPRADVNGDGAVDVIDYGYVVGDYGTRCQ